MVFLKSPANSYFKNVLDFIASFHIAQNIGEAINGRKKSTLTYFRKINNKCKIVYLEFFHFSYKNL